ncbi:tetratricopeptide repeat protein, partial [Trebonia sp.]|uniref:tetratricopeptide repeat protein n=1 Tax=Trebonia sp. TaxID=2767075 RepID=UPI003CC628CA
MEVPVLDIGAAADFMVNRTGDPDRQAARELAAELDCLPLALEQAAAYIQASWDNLAGYLESFRQRRADMLALGESNGYNKTVATTWTLAFEHLQPGAVGLLRMLASCAPEAIPLRLLLQPRPGLAEQLGPAVAPVLVPLLEEPLAASDAIAALRRYSLVIPAGVGSVSVHRLVQVVTADQIPADLADQWHQATTALIEAAIPGDTDSPETWPACAALLPHAQATLADNSPGMARLANYLGARGSYTSALELQQRVLEARERSLGPEHPDTLTARHSLASWTGQAGDAAGARDRYAALLPTLERVLGPEHPDTLATRGSLARWTGQAGDPAGARDRYAALLPTLERVLGPEHPDTLATRSVLARWAGEAGDAAGARDRYAALLPARERVLGPEHPDTLATRHNLARWAGEAGDAAGARDRYAGLLPVVERV